MVWDATHIKEDNEKFLMKPCLSCSEAATCSQGSIFPQRLDYWLRYTLLCNGFLQCRYLSCTKTAISWRFHQPYYLQHYEFFMSVVECSATITRVRAYECISSNYKRFETTQGLHKSVGFHHRFPQPYVLSLWLSCFWPTWQSLCPTRLNHTSWNLWADRVRLLTEYAVCLYSVSHNDYESRKVSSSSHT